MKIGSKQVKEIFYGFHQTMKEKETYLVELDSVAGDGDLGLAMNDGFTAIAQMFKDYEEEDIGKLLFAIAKKMNEAASSSAGTLLSSAFMTSARALKGVKEMGYKELTLMVSSWLEGIVKMGGAKRGEKTLLDALIPAVEAMNSYQGEDLKELSAKAANAAKQGAEETKELLAVHGKMAVKGQKSIGMWDPGAVMISLLMQSMAESIQNMQK
ncbi:MAG: DAK2 domain-containing protein [Muricomes sp.]|uniref:DAK2 domain-containing protein n=1 Tax=Faecalicatena contorta TaxID=39482 RepID=UPI002EA58237|nr:DAK2 domain-containing protein [Muricomes sp.]